MKYLIIIFLITVFNLIIPAQTVRRTIQISADLQLVQITDHAWVHVSVAEIAGFGKVSSNGLVYIQNHKAFLFDTPVNDIQTEVLVKAVSDSLKSKIVGFVPNHWHEDCMGGLKYLQSLKIKSYANQLTIEEAKTHNLATPAHGFTETLRLKLSGKTIECWYPGGGHTKDNIVVWLPSEKVLFAGCMAKEMKSNSPGNLSDADIKSWPSTIEKVIAKYKDAKIVVPGHGQWGGPELLNHTLDLVSNLRQKKIKSQCSVAINNRNNRNYKTTGTTETMNFKSKRCFLSAQQHLNFTPEKIFPQLCPTREYDWIEFWKCELIHSESGFAELDCVFTTHFPGDEKEIWVVDRFEPNELIEFVRTTESRTMRHSIRLSNNNDGTTTLFWLQIITGLNENGNKYVESCSNEEFRQEVKALEKMLAYYLETGKMLRIS